MKGIELVIHVTLVLVSLVQSCPTLRSKGVNGSQELVEVTVCIIVGPKRGAVVGITRSLETLLRPIVNDGNTL